MKKISLMLAMMAFIASCKVSQTKTQSQSGYSKEFLAALGKLSIAAAKDTLKDPYSLKKLEDQSAIQDALAELLAVAKTPAERVMFLGLSELCLSKFPQPVRDDYALDSLKKATTNKKSESGKELFRKLEDMNFANHVYNEMLFTNKCTKREIKFVNGEIDSISVMKHGGKIAFGLYLKRHASEYLNSELFLIGYYLLSSDGNKLKHFTKQDMYYMSRMKSSCPMYSEVSDTTQALAFTNGEVVNAAIEMNISGQVFYRVLLKKNGKNQYSICERPIIKSYVVDCTVGYVASFSADEIENVRCRLGLSICPDSGTVGGLAAKF